jgi:hypothetical protein
MLMKPIYRPDWKDVADRQAALERARDSLREIREKQYYPF